MLASPAMELQTEETPLALQRLWNLTRARLAGTSTALDVEPELVDSLPIAREPEGTSKSYLPAPSDYESDAEEAFPELEIHEQPEVTTKGYWTENAYAKEVLLDASLLGDVPAVYRVPAPAPYQMPVIGVYIDPRVRTGFRYKVRPMQDIYFVSDCGENILRALLEPMLVVRTKAAWALGNLSDALVLNMEEPDMDCIDDDLLRRLLDVSIQCAVDNDKVKMSATRGLGNLLRLIRNENLLRDPQMKTLCESAIEKLMDCACKVTNMKVRWNACYAMGNAMKNEHLFTCFNGWQRLVFPNLCALSQDCKNLKVRINAAVALRSPAARAHYGDHYALVWRGVLAAMENAANVDDFTEYKHKDNLIEQLCVTLAHMCCMLTPTDLTDILDPLVFHYECAKALFTQLCHKLPPENVSCLKILQAAKYVTVDLTAGSDTQSQSLGMLQDIFIWDM